MAFKAESVVMALDYDFRPHVEAVGCTPEPSDDAVRHFQWKLREAVRKLPDDDATLDTMNEEDFATVSSEILDAVSNLTAGRPSRDELEALPFRIQRAYIDWLREELTNPEAPSAATKLSPVPTRIGTSTTRRAGS